MSRFAEQAQSLLDAALAALERGETCTEVTILIGWDGGLQMCSDSDWPLESLMLDRGARTGYRVSPRRGSVRVEGREGLRRCVLEGSIALRAAAGIGQLSFPLNGYAAHRIGIDRVGTGNRQMALTVRQDDMFALANNPKPGLLKRSNRFQVRDAGKFAQSL